MTAAATECEIVFVWLGGTLPDWARVSLRLAGQTAGLPTVLICSRTVGTVDGIGRQVWLEDFYESPEWKWEAKKGARSRFRDGFWRKTFERFIVLEQFATSGRAAPFFHAEVDNLLFRINDLGPRLDAIGRGCFCPRDARARGVASLVYVNEMTALSRMIEVFFDERIAMTSDMEVLGHMLQHDSGFYSLPNERVLAPEASPAWRTLSVEDTGGVFDANALGQFMFGIDPRNGGICMRNGFPNEYRGCDLWTLRIHLDIAAGKCTLSRKEGGEGEIHLYNIHVHSKLFHTIADPLALTRIIDRLNKGQTTLLSVRLVQWRPIRAMLSRMNMS